MTRRLLAAALGASLIVASCSSDDEGAGDVVTDDTSDDSAVPGDSTATTADTTDVTDDTDDTENSAPAGADQVGVEGGSGCGIPHGPYDDPGEPSRRGARRLERPVAVVQQQLLARQRARRTANPCT